MNECACGSWAGTKDWVHDAAGDDFFYTSGVGNTGTISITNLPDLSYTIEFVSAYTGSSAIGDYQVDGVTTGGQPSSS